MALPAMLAYWPLNEGTGTTSADASGNGHGVTLAPGRVSWDVTTQKFGAAALRKSGTPDGNMATFAAIDLGVVHTVAAWVSASPLPPTGAIVAGTGASGAAHAALLVTNVDVRYVIDGLTRFAVHGLGSFAIPKHICVTRSDATVRFYVDGVPLAAPASMPGEGPLTVGALGGFTVDSPSLYWQGMIDDVRLWNVALTAAQVAELSALVPDDVEPPPVSASGPGLSFLINYRMQGEGVSKATLVKAARAASPGLTANAALHAYCLPYWMSRS